jgi:hypothetical protein
MIMIKFTQDLLPRRLELLHMFAAKMCRSNLHLYIHIQVYPQEGQTMSVKRPSQVLKKNATNGEATYPPECI